MQVEPNSHQVLCSVARVYQLVQFSKSLPSPRLTNEETKAQRLRNPPRPQLPTAKGGFTHRQSGCGARAPNRTLLVLGAPSLHPLSEQGVQAEPGGDSANARSLVRARAEAEVEMTHLCRPCGVPWSLPEQRFIPVRQPLQSLQNFSKAVHPLNKRPKPDIWSPNPGLQFLGASAPPRPYLEQSEKV